MCLSPFLMHDKKNNLVKVACGMCVECVKKRASEWTGRILMESVYYATSSFITFTYRDEFLPAEGVSRDVMSKLTKRLYQRVPGLRYYVVGEYGGLFGRPHYHAILFGVDMHNSPLVVNPKPEGDGSYRCLCPAWSFGQVSVEEACPENMAYIAGYVKSKMDVQKRIILEAGRNPTCNNMSLKPCIGYQYMVDHKDKLIRDGCVKLGGHEYVLPTYFKERILNDRERFLMKLALMKEYKSEFDLDVETLGSRHLAAVIQKDRLRVRAAEANFKEVVKNAKKG